MQLSDAQLDVLSAEARAMSTQFTALAEEYQAALADFSQQPVSALGAPSGLPTVRIAPW